MKVAREKVVIYLKLLPRPSLKGTEHNHENFQARYVVFNTRISFSEVKEPKHEADHLSASTGKGCRISEYLLCVAYIRLHDAVLAQLIFSLHYNKFC
jgi:hypothetical protein